MAQIDKLLHFMVESKASDLHVKTASAPLLRVDGRLQKMKLPPMSEEQVTSLAYEIMSERNQREFEARNDTDLCYEMPGLARFRTNVYRDMNGASIAMRLIPFDIMTVDDLGLPQQIRDLAMLPKGIVLCTGPTGCGKTTTLAAMVRLANEKRTDHIITIEDPIEFVHKGINCIISHRQVGIHCESFKRALREALREDPDILMVGELRDLETTALAIECAETGHLVFATVHTTTASSTVDRIVDQFPADRQEQIRIMLANTLKAVITQALCRRKGKGRVAAFEILYCHSAVGNLIREKKTFQLPSIIQTGKKYGMTTMNESLLRLFSEAIIDMEEAYAHSTDKQDMNQRVNTLLLQKVSEKKLDPVESVRQSFFKPGMVEMLQKAGYGKAVARLDLSQMEQPLVEVE